MSIRIKKAIEKMLVKPGKKISLKDYQTDFKQKGVEKEEGEALLKAGIEQLAEMQDILYAHNEHSLLVVIQAMDAAGKDSAVKHVMRGLNPTGVKVTPFKAPTHQEYEHDYLWRHNLALPGRGEIGIFIRSHYENVLVTRVHPQYVLNERMPGVDTVKKVDKALFKQRFRQINDWERHLHENGTTIIKIFLHVSKEEQKKQFLERIDDPAKNWKFSMGDLKERALWEDYMQAYEDVFNHTSTPEAPWYIVPADDKWFARLSIAAIIRREFERLDISYPKLTAQQTEELAEARKILMAEK